MRALLEGDAVPAWWLIEILNEDDETVLTERSAATSATGTVDWTGRNQTGDIVNNGVYTIVVTPQDASWNSGEACEETILVDNRVQAPQ